jgi:hypothetical protein
MQYIQGSTLETVIRELRRKTGSAPHPEAEPRSTRIAARLLSADFASPAAETRDADGVAVPSGSSRARDFELSQDEASPSSASAAEIFPERSVRERPFFHHVARLGIQIAEALEYAHSLGVVHRDVKPSNLLLDEQGKVWVADLGLAQIDSEASLAMTGDVLGTIRYMSPEQAMGRRGMADPRTDIYSLGVTLYELLTFRPAFSSADRSVLLRQVLQEEPPPPRSLNSAIPRDLETIVLKAIAKERQARYDSAQDLADDLRRFLADQPIRAKRPTLLERASKWTQRHRGVVAAVLLLTTAVLAVSTLLVGQAYEEQQLAARREAAQRARADHAREQAQAETALALRQQLAARRQLHGARIQLAEQEMRRGRWARPARCSPRSAPGPANKTCGASLGAISGGVCAAGCNSRWTLIPAALSPLPTRPTATFLLGRGRRHR